MNAREVVEIIRKNLGVPWNDQSYRDTFKAGNPDIAVRGIASTCMATFDLIQRAKAAGMNMIVTHEPTWWSDSDSTDSLLNDTVYKAKAEYCLKNDMVVWRFHDHWHARKPDMELYGTLRALGFAPGDPKQYTGPGECGSPDGCGLVYTIPATTFGEYASKVRRQLDAKALRAVGDPDARVTTVTVGVGSGMPRINTDAQIVIGGETGEVDGAIDNSPYAVDAAALGLVKGQIIMGHVISEELGMDECAKWLRTLVDVPVQFIKAGEPFWG
jgi:putative NIF3 family GTP cyclohydrolase 1 type 2